MDPTLSIPAFYSGKSVLITGATGYLGKVLIEKLLRSCPDIENIFLLMRARKNMNIDERLQQLLAKPLFDILRQERPHCFDKLIPVEGDIGLEDLGLSAADRDILIEKTSVIFHVAASVRFENTLRDAVFTNVRSTRNICILGEQVKNLAVLVHVSTAYTQVDKVVIDEIMYPTEIDWRKTIQIVETLDEHMLEVFKSKYTDTMPNHYVFTKRLAEQVIMDYSGSLPCVICRPSIVSPTIREPFKGWLDNFNGPVGSFVGVGKGVMRVLRADPTTFDNYVPLDVVVKTMIVAAWKHGSRITNTQDYLLSVYNCVGNHATRPGRAMLNNIAAQISKKFPLEGIIWTPSLITIKSLFLYHLLMMPFVILALFIDGVLRLSGRQPRLLEVQRKIFINNRSLSYFIMNEWEFRNKKMLSLSDEVPSNNQRDFGYTADLSYDITTYFENCLIGSKIYLLKESMDRLDAAKSHYKRMVWIDRIAKTLMGILFIWIIYRTIM